MEEYSHAKRSLKLGKCTEPHNIPPEVLKTCDLDDTILSFCSQTLTNSSKPDQWSQSNTQITGDTEEFELTAVILRRDMLTLFIFVIVLDCVLRKAIAGRESELG